MGIELRQRNPDKKLLVLVRYGAYGDMIFMSGVLPYLLEKYDIVFETNTKGMELFNNDPRFIHMGYFEPWRIPESRREQVTKDHWGEIERKWGEIGAEFLNFYQAMEGTGIVPEWLEESVWPIEKRAEKYGINFYEQHFEMAGLKMPKDFVPSDPVIFNDKEINWAENWRKAHKDEFLIIIPIAGSTMQKVFPAWLPSFGKKIIDKFPKSRIYLLGDAEASDEDWEYKRTKSLVHRKGRTRTGFRQALIAAKYADYVLGPETGILVGAGAFGTPKTTLMTSAHKDQFCKYQLNDYSVQSLAPCSPCYRTCYTGALCEKEMMFGIFPRCTVAWDFNGLLDTIERLYIAKGL